MEHSYNPGEGLYEITFMRCRGIRDNVARGPKIYMNYQVSIFSHPCVLKSRNGRIPSHIVDIDRVFQMSAAHF